jgi:hypothetical protein
MTRGIINKPRTLNLFYKNTVLSLYAGGAEKDQADLKGCGGKDYKKLKAAGLTFSPSLLSNVA